MQEIEVKVIEIDSKKVLRKLSSLKAKKVGDYNIEYAIFDNPKKEFSKKKCLIRLRKKGKCFITFKGKEKRGFARKAEEIEFEVSDFNCAKTFLEKLGLVSSEIVKKHRVSYELNKALIEIDTYPGIPCFLEIEAKSEKKIKEIIELLELPIANVRTWNSFDLFEYYGKKHLF